MPSSKDEVRTMIAAIILALSFWILGVLFALCGFCALGCLIGLFLSVLTSFKAPMRLMAVPLWAVFSFACLGACWLMQWVYTALGNNAGHGMQYWFLVGSIVPGILGVTLVPKFIVLATGGNKRAITPSPGTPAKV